MGRRATLAIALSALVFLAAGCGGDDDVASPQAAPNPAAAQMYADGAAIQHLADYINNAFAVSPAEGLVALTSSNYLVWNGTYTAQQCLNALRSQLGTLAGARLSETFALNTLHPTPGRVIDAAGGTPEGRLYTVSAVVQWGDITGTSTSVTADVTVLSDGTAKSFRKCA
jgi:hypothetical protein